MSNNIKAMLGMLLLDESKGREESFWSELRSLEYQFRCTVCLSCYKILINAKTFLTVSGLRISKSQ